jgi:transporter family-2 protein
MRAALVNNAICFGLMVVIVLVTAGGSTGVVADRVPWHYIGGLAGTAIVIITLLAVRPLGATALTVAVVTGQLLLATLIDRFGWLGLEVHTITLPRAAGLGLVVAGLALIAKG